MVFYEIITEDLYNTTNIHIFMERIVDDATIIKLSKGKYKSRLLVEEHLTAEDMLTVKNSLNNAIANIEQQIKQGKEQIKQVKSQIPLLKKKKEEMESRLRKAAHLFKEAEELAPKNEESSETTKDD